MTPLSRSRSGYGSKVQWFMYFHTNTPIPEKESNGDSAVITIEAKKRPVIVLGRKWKVDLSTARDTGRVSSYPSKLDGKINEAKVFEAHATLGYLVLPLQSSLPKNQRLRAECLELKRGMITPDRTSVIHLRPQVYPSLALDQSSKPLRLPDAVAEIVWEELFRRGRDENLEWDFE